MRQAGGQACGPATRVDSVYPAQEPAGLAAGTPHGAVPCREPLRQRTSQARTAAQARHGSCNKCSHSRGGRTTTAHLQRRTASPGAPLTSDTRVITSGGSTPSRVMSARNSRSYRRARSTKGTPASLELHRHTDAHTQTHGHTGGLEWTRAGHLEWGSRVGGADTHAHVGLKA